jgi:hypothetical protein
VAVGAKSAAGATRASDAWSVLAAHKLTADTRGHAPALSIAAMRRVDFHSYALSVEELAPHATLKMPLAKLLVPTL